MIGYRMLRRNDVEYFVCYREETHIPKHQRIDRNKEKYVIVDFIKKMVVGESSSKSKKQYGLALWAVGTNLENKQNQIFDKDKHSAFTRACLKHQELLRKENGKSVHPSGIIKEIEHKDSAIHESGKSRKNESNPEISYDFYSNSGG